MRKLSPQQLAVVVLNFTVEFDVQMEQRGMVMPAPSDEEGGSDSDTDKPFTFTEQELENVSSYNQYFFIQHKCCLETLSTFLLNPSWA